MNIHVWERTGPVSNSWHDYGGLLIVAWNIDEARELWKAYAADRKLDNGDAAEEAPDHIFNTRPDAAPQIIVFPDQGCC